jgi:hypothetical protein
MPQPLYLRRKSPRYPLDRRLAGPQSRSGRRGEKKILDHTGTRTPTPPSSSPWPVAIPAPYNNRGTAGNGVFCGGSMSKSYKEKNWGNQASSVRDVTKRDSWKGAVIQRGLEHGSRRITIRSRYRATTSEDSAGWKILKCVCDSDL